jgi:hypothetical protein
MVQVYHLQKAHPDAGEFRIWSLLARPDLSVRTVGRIMALNAGHQARRAAGARHERTLFAVAWMPWLGA